jgi:hypothetical protein
MERAMFNPRSEFRILRSIHGATVTLAVSV